MSPVESNSSLSKEGLIDKLFHHKHHEEGEPQANDSHPAQPKEPQKKEGEATKLEEDIDNDKQEFKDYLKEDKKLEKEGDEYGGLM
jgi:hypothetical protein